MQSHVSLPLLLCGEDSPDTADSSHITTIQPCISWNLILYPTFRCFSHEPWLWQQHYLQDMQLLQSSCSKSMTVLCLQYIISTGQRRNMKKLCKPEAARSREKNHALLQSPFHALSAMSVTKSVAPGSVAKSAKKCPVRMPLNLDCFISLQFILFQIDLNLLPSPLMFCLLTVAAGSLMVAMSMFGVSSPDSCTQAGWRLQCKLDDLRLV